MVQPPCLVALQELKTIPAPEDQLNLLRLLKNDIVGHGQRKELVVQNGLLDPLVTILDSANKSSGKQALDRDCRSSRADLDDDIRLQAIMIVGSLANGEPHPLCVSTALPFHLIRAHVLQAGRRLLHPFLQATFHRLFYPPLTQARLHPRLLSLP